MILFFKKIFRWSVPFFSMLDWLFRSWLIALLLSLLSIFLGLVVGAYSHEIADPIRKLFSGATGANKYSDFFNEIVSIPELRLFVVILCVFAILFGIREKLTVGAAKKKEILLLKTLSSMPPKDFTEDLYTLLITLRSIVSLNPSDLGQAETSIREYLKTILVLAMKFQSQSFGARYGANIMILVPIDQFDRTEENLKDLEKFTDGMDLRNLDAVLLGEKVLSVSTEEEGNCPDPSLTRLIMPIPCQGISETNGRKKYLPGAPSAFFEGSYIIGNTFHILDHFNKTSDYDIAHSIFKRGDDYFKSGEGSRVRSFVSIKLDRYSVDDIQCVGVLNIHSNGKDIFPDNEIFNDFRRIILPITAELAELVYQYLNLKFQKASTSTQA